MANQYGTIITDVGSARIADCILNGGKVGFVQAAAGDGGGRYYKPESTQTALVNEVWRGDIASAQVNPDTPNMIDVLIVIPAGIGEHFIREMGLFAEDGSLLAVCNTTLAQTTDYGTGASVSIKMMMHILVENTSVVEFTVNSSLDTVSREEMKAAIAGATSSVIITSFTIPAEGWAASSAIEQPVEGDEYLLYIDVPYAKALDAYVPHMALSKAALVVASAAELCSAVDAIDGAIRFWAKSKPSKDMAGTLTLFSPSGGSYPDFEIATDEEVSETIEDVFGEGSGGGTMGGTSAGDGYEIADDTEVSDMITDIFG